MKKLYYVSYDLVKAKDYPKLWEALKSVGAVRVLESVWCFSRVGTTATELRDHLRQFIDADDRLLVIESANWAGWRLLSDPNKV